MFDIAIVIAKIRLWYHANMTSIVNAGNQLRIISDEKAEELNKNHVMTIFNDILPRIYGQDKVDKLLSGEL